MTQNRARACTVSPSLSLFLSLSASSSSRRDAMRTKRRPVHVYVAWSDFSRGGRVLHGRTFPRIGGGARARDRQVDPLALRRGFSLPLFIAAAHVTARTRIWNARSKRYIACIAATIDRGYRAAASPCPGIAGPPVALAPQRIVSRGEIRPVDHQGS